MKLLLVSSAITLTVISAIADGADTAVDGERRLGNNNNDDFIDSFEGIWEGIDPVNGDNEIVEFICSATTSFPGDSCRVLIQDPIDDQCSGYLSITTGIIFANNFEESGEADEDGDADDFTTGDINANELKCVGFNPAETGRTKELCEYWGLCENPFGFLPCSDPDEGEGTNTCDTAVQPIETLLDSLCTDESVGTCEPLVLAFNKSDRKRRKGFKKKKRRRRIKRNGKTYRKKGGGSKKDRD
mmetsp:Transcript_22421/g.48711  ORF Transcript_22421/g.48711 Transcript_22421/m.48711 type:complete len:243 (-) Transcript_22421:84-812(-)|eukprot:CAMPEP_0178507578 /NCGR_PEP_ID=MMETSP0696-20121128/20292_1 /TAXON_ID=265572 /ORGANISM="Extubocellulus spinifer, Strain CCMP396" /LENGTH=242 /DNA_ID=CAMNT_0020137071 /DNA_START=268 /DNA_END=996 /DNA_ORIENTATION=+